MKHLIDHAREAGDLMAARFRVVVEQERRVFVRDFGDIEAARGYADDAVAEYGESPTIAIVVDERWVVVHQGRPYFAP